MLYNAYATVAELPPLGFPHTFRSHRDHRDPALGPHLQGFIGFVMGGGAREMTPVRYALYRHIQRVQHQVALEVHPADLPAFYAWCKAANAVIFAPDASVLDSGGAVLCAPESGAAAPGARVPYPPEAEARKARSQAALAERGVRVAASLPPVVGDTELVPRTPDAVLERAEALFICALRAESLGGGRPIPAADLRARFPRGAAALSPNERAFLDADRPDQQAVVNHAWGYEALAVMVWALGAGPLPFPLAIVEVPALAKTMLGAAGAAWTQPPALRPAAELLDALDLHYRLHWHTTEVRLGRAEAGEVEPGVVMERHRALNWLVGFEGADWDEVDTPT